MGRDRSSLGNRPERVISAGEVPDGEWFALLGAADVGLALWTPRMKTDSDASRYNTPLAWNRLYWYLAAGLPVVAGGHDELRAFITETGAGVFVRDVHAASLAEAVRDLLLRRTEFSARAAEAFHDSFNFESQMAGVLPLM